MLSEQGLAEQALQFAITLLSPGGKFLVKILQGGTGMRSVLPGEGRCFRSSSALCSVFAHTEEAFRQELRVFFSKVRFLKPKTSRSESAEMYLLAEGFVRLHDI